MRYLGSALSIGRIFTILLLLQLVVSQSSSSTNGTLCEKVFFGDVYFTLFPIAKENYYRYKLLKNNLKQGNLTESLFPDDKFKSVELETEANFSPLGYDLLFNFCTSVKFVNKTDLCQDELNKIPKTYAMIAQLIDASDKTKPENAQNNEYGACNKINVKEFTADSKFEKYEFVLIDENKPQEGFYYRQWDNTQTIWSDNAATYNPLNTSITYIMRCDYGQQSLQYQGWRQVINATNFDLYLEIRTIYGCPTLKISKVWQVLEDRNILKQYLGGLLFFKQSKFLFQHYIRNL